MKAEGSRDRERRVDISRKKQAYILSPRFSGTPAFKGYIRYFPEGKKLMRTTDLKTA